MLLGTRWHVVDELSRAAKVCMLSSPSACQKNGSFTFFFWAAWLLLKTNAPPLSCGRQVAMLLAFTVGRHIQKGWVRKDSSPFWTSCLSPFSHWVSLRASPLTSVIKHNTHKNKTQRWISGLTVYECVLKCVWKGVPHFFLCSREEWWTFNMQEKKLEKRQVMQELHIVNSKINLVEKKKSLLNWNLIRKNGHRSSDWPRRDILTVCHTGPITTDLTPERPITNARRGVYFTPVSAGADSEQIGWGFCSNLFHIYFTWWWICCLSPLPFIHTCPWSAIWCCTEALL